MRERRRRSPVVPARGAQENPTPDAYQPSESPGSWDGDRDDDHTGDVQDDVDTGEEFV